MPLFKINEFQAIHLRPWTIDKISEINSLKAFDFPSDLTEKEDFPPYLIYLLNESNKSVLESYVKKYLELGGLSPDLEKILQGYFVQLMLDARELKIPEEKILQHLGALQKNFREFGLKVFDFEIVDSSSSVSSAKTSAPTRVPPRTGFSSERNGFYKPKTSSPLRNEVHLPHEFEEKGGSSPRK